MKKRLLSIVLALVMIMSLFAGMGITASAAGRIIDITQEANLTVTNKSANIYYVQGLREYHEQRDANNWTKFFGQWAWVLSESDARAKLNELMRSPSSMDSQPSTLSVISPNNEPANFHLNGEKADTLLIWAKAQPMSVNEGGYYYALLPMPKEITFTTNLNSSYSISSVDSKTLTVEATCADYDGTLTYQWYYCGKTSSKVNATPIEGATGNSCTVKPATAKESHYYFCRVTAGDVVGDSVVAGVYASDPYVYINNTANIYGTCYAVTGKPYTMEITNATTNVENGEISYQWYRCTDSEGTGAEAIEGATTASFAVPTNNKGTYYYFCKAYIKGDGLENCNDETMIAKVIVRDAHKITAVGTPGEDGYTIVEGGKFYFSSVNGGLQDDLTCPTNETCRLTYEPDNGYTVDKILVYKTGEPEVTVELEEWDSDTKEFTMPDFNITVEVTFKKPEPIEKVDLTVDWSRVPSIGVGDNVLDARFNEYYDWAVFADGAGAVNGPVEMTIFTVKVTESNKKEICDAIVASGFNGLTPDGLTDMLEMLGCGAWLHPEFLFSIADGYVVKENDELAIMPIIYPYSGYFPVVDDAMFGAYNGTVTCNGETVSNSAVFGEGSMAMLLPFVEVGTVSDLTAKKNAAKTEVFDVFYYDELGYTTGGSYGVMPGIAAKDETITIRVNPDEGYEVDTVTWQPFVMASDEGDDVNVVTPVDGKYTFTMPNQSVMVKVTFKATATEPDDGGDETGNIENLGEEIFSIDEEGNVTFNTPTDDGYIYYTIVLPTAALEGSGITAEQYVEYYMEGTKHPVMDVTDSSVFDLSNMEAVAALTHSGTGQVYVTNAAVDGTNYPWTISSDSIIAVMKLSADNMVSGAYGNSYFPGLGVTDVYAYGIHGVYAEFVEFGGSGGEGGEVDDGLVAELGEDWITRSGNTVTINVPNGEKYMLGIVNHADNEDSEYYRDYFNDFIGQQILTSENFEDEYDNYSYVAICDGEMEGEYGCVGINELLTGDGTPIVLNITEDQSIFLFHVSTNPYLNSYGYKAYAILGVHAEAYIYDANAPTTHEHSYTYTANNNGTHNGACACGEDAIVNEACAYASGVCEKCGAAEPVAHEHSYTYTSNNNGTHNGACACGEDAIVNEACAYASGVCEKCGASEPVAPPTVNVPVSNGDNKVDVKVEVSDNDATIQPLDKEQIEQLMGGNNDSGDIIIDLTGLDKNIDTANIPKSTLEAIVEAAKDASNNVEHLVIKLSTAELKFDNTAMGAIVEQANGDVIKFNFDDVGLGRLNEAQKESVKDMDIRKGYEAYITVNDQRIGDFKGGEVEIIVPYAVPEGEELANFSVWYISDDGTLEKQESTYDGKEKCFIVSHFSDYVIVYSGNANNNGLIWMISIIAICAVAGVVIFFVFKKRKQEENEAE